MIRLTIRATDKSIVGTLIKTMEQRLAIGVSTLPDTQENLTKREIDDTFGNILVT